MCVQMVPQVLLLVATLLGNCAAAAAEQACEAAISELTVRTKKELEACKNTKAAAEQKAADGNDVLATAAAKATRDSDSAMAALKQRHAEALTRAASDKKATVQRHEEEANKVAARLRKEHAREVSSLKREISALAAGQGMRDCIPEMYI